MDMSMFRKVGTAVLVAAIVVMAAVGVSSKLDKAAEANAILAAIDKILAPELFTAKVELSQKEPGEPIRTYVMMVYNRGSDKTLIEFLAPPVEKGRKMLRRGEEMWMLVPSSERPIKVAAKQDFMGTNFSNTNMIRLRLSDDYTATIEEETSTQYTLFLKAKDASVAYDTVRLWVDKKSMLPTRQEYYSTSGKLIKMLEYSQPKLYGQVNRPSVMVMSSTLNKSVSEYTIKALSVGKTLPENRFTVAGLR